MSNVALQTVVVVLAIVFSAIAATTLSWMLWAWRTPEQMLRTGFPDVREPVHSFSLLLAARHEERVLYGTLARLSEQRHPDFEIVCIIGHDDAETLAIVRAAEKSLPNIRVVIDENWPKSKPKALNTALPTCTSDVIGVFDAEDIVHPDLLLHVDTMLQEPEIDMVQSGVQLMNFWSNWYSVRNVLEYYFWFRSRLHFHAAAGFIPLGGNTVFLRTALLRRYEGWDADCLAEDCEVGVRLSSAGHRTAVAYEPAMVTREETPPTLRALFRQRTRWNQGFLQVLKKGEWRKLRDPRRRALAVYTLAMPFLQAFIGLLIPLAVVSVVLLKFPLPLTLLTFIPLMLTLLTLVIETVGLSEFGRLFERRVRVRDYLALVLGTVPYMIMLAMAAVRAVWREYRGDRSWEKTAHVGAHLATAPAASGGKP